MLSILLYGRNDSHGYNLHKRAALSLNCIAASLTDPDDEILFVDYNTPDELPTFPEAISDTLTEVCKAKLRIIRVRPSFHRQFAGRTRLAALESQSRNIAVRRANPANRWVLSTNTDMIFCAKDEAQTLTSVLAGLDDGFYHLPRFEVPEGFWERLDRTDPEHAIAAMRDNGRRFHLNEIVWGTTDNLFEAPGDFQLFTRDDLYAIEGFDERMLVGWHVDSNIARRMRLLRGEVKCPFPILAGYHCGHTRQATALHGGDRTQNDFEFFVTSVADPVARHQAGTWGAPDQVFEEVRLDHPDRYFPAMAAAVPAAGPEFSEVTYNDTSFGRVNVDPDHALPHLCDLLFNFPPRQTIFFFGADVRLLEGLRAFLEAAGREPRFVLGHLEHSPRPGDLDPGRWAGAARPLQEALAAADIIILQNPSADMAPDADRLEAEWWTQRVFALVADLERGRPVPERRRIIVVNAIHTAITNMCESVLAPTVTPFSSRLRQGFVMDDAPAAQRNPLEAPIYDRLRRRRGFTPQDRTLLDRVIGSLLKGEPAAGWERLAPEIAAICTSPAPVAEGYGFDADGARAWAAASDVAMRANIARAIEAPVVVDPRPGTGNRLLSASDWDDPAWGRLAVTYFGPDVMSFRERKRWVWERASLAVCIGGQLPVLASAPPPRILVLASSPEYLAAMLTHMGYEVAYASVSDFIAGARTGAWQEALDLTSMLLPKPLEAFDPGAPQTPLFDALAVTLPSLFEGSRDDMESVLHKAAPLMAPGGLFFATATVQMNEVAYEGALSFAEWKALYAQEGPLGMRGFSAVGGVDMRIPLDTAVRFAAEDDMADTIPGLSYGFLRGFNSSALICARWPEVLAPGPGGRIEYEGPPRPDPLSIEVPYSGAVLPMDAATAMTAPAARAAAFMAAKSLQAYGREALASQHPILTVARPPRNALPHIQPLDAVRRTPVGADLESPGGAGFVLAVQAAESRSVRLDLDLPEGVTITEAVVVFGWGGSPDVRIEGSVVTAVHETALGAIAFVIRLSQTAVRLDRLTLGPGPEAA